MELLRTGEKSVNELAAQFDVARPAISRHLRVLREAGLVQYRSAHNVRYYSLRQPELEKLQDSLAQNFQDYWAPQGSSNDMIGAQGIDRLLKPGFHVHVATELALPIEEAYAQFTDEKRFRSWVGQDAHNSGEPGGRFSAVSAFGGRLEGEYLATRPPHFVAMRITSPISPEENFYTIAWAARGTATRVDLRHYVVNRQVAVLLRSAWSNTFALLKRAVEEGRS